MLDTHTCKRGQSGNRNCIDAWLLFAWTPLQYLSPVHLLIFPMYHCTTGQWKVSWPDSRWVSVVEFHDRALSIGKVFGQESTVVKWNYQILSLHLVTVRQKVPILDFQSEFSMSKIIRIFLKKFFIEEYQFKGTFFVKSIFCWLQFLNHFITKMTPNFWQTVTWWRHKIW